MGKIELVPAAEELPAGLRLRAARDGPPKPLGNNNNTVKKTEEVIEEVVQGVKLLLWTDLRKCCAYAFVIGVLTDVVKPSGSSEFGHLGSRFKDDFFDMLDISERAIIT